MAKLHHRHHARALHVEERAGNYAINDGQLKGLPLNHVEKQAGHPLHDVPLHHKGHPLNLQAHEPKDKLVHHKGRPLNVQANQAKGHPVHHDGGNNGGNDGGSNGPQPTLSLPSKGPNVVPDDASLGSGWHLLSTGPQTQPPTTDSAPKPSAKPNHKEGNAAPKGASSSISAPSKSTYSAPVRQHRPTPHPSATPQLKGTPLSHSTASSSPVAGHPVKQDQGMSSGGKAGLAIGIILIVGILAGLAFLFYRRKKSKNDSHKKLDDEKSTAHNQQSSISSHVSVRRPNKEAPRLSLRPMTELMFASPEERANHAMSINQNAGTRSAPSTDAMQDTSATAVNPFDDHSNATALDLQAKGASPNSSPNLSEHSNGRNSPAPSGAAPNNVHRVQLDFKPSMEDELELKAGQVVRMLHEYDDGWALCIRLDRSQQGVVPRTCISKLPIKPRPRHPAAAGSRGPPRAAPQNGQSKRNSPTESISSSSTRSSDSHSGQEGRARAQSNAQQGSRSQSPSAEGRPRSSTSAGYPDSRRISPPSPLNPAATGGNVPIRKPVPGQAL